jgi:hypothetical protein
MQNIEPQGEFVLGAIANGQAPEGTTCSEAYTVSIAVSLKRIADALWGIEGTSGLLQLLNPLDVRNNY